MQPPLSGWLGNPVIRLLANIRFGVSMMLVILVYACVASALPQVRGALEMTEMEIFRHWLFFGLIIVLGISIITATLTRIAFNRFNAGVLTVHTGLLMLVIGSIVYFSTKIEGDALLISPKVQVVSIAGSQQRVIAEVLAEKGQKWETTMPAFGGSARVEVVDVARDSAGIVSSAVITAAIGAEEKQFRIDNGSAGDLAGGRLVVQLQPAEPVRTFYDNETAALFVRKAGADRPTVMPIEGLPFFRERYLDEGYVLKDTEGREVPSKRTTPNLAIGSAKIPTQWFEHWRMPIELDAGELPFSVRVTGYVPYISRFDSTAVESSTGPHNPAAEVSLAVGEASISEPLFALQPAKSMMSRGIPVEYRWAADEAEQAAYLKPMASTHELFVQVIDPPVSKTMAIIRGQSIKIEGTPYELSIKDLQPNWPLMTPGFEGASSPMASVDVTNGEKSYNRTVIQRYPALSQDIDEQGVRHREGPYDPNLILKYRTAENGWVTIVGGPKLTPRIAVFDQTGAATVSDVELGKSQRVSIMNTPVDLKIAKLLDRAASVEQPIIEPLERRRPNLAARSVSAVRLKFTPKDGKGDTVTRWCVFSQYPHTDARPIQLRVPGDESDYEVIFSRLPRSLGAALIPGKLSVKFFPGRQNVESWRSDFWVSTGEDAAPRPAAVYTNQTCGAGRWTLFQSGAAPDHWSYTILGVGNRNGIWTMLIGCTLIPLGCFYAFYVKPVLIRGRRKNGAPRESKDDDDRAAASRGGNGHFATDRMEAVVSHPEEEVHV
ncbi:MAG: hypothetical protein IT419_10855 [Planctomycetes bacterium]|nr:hypothetical protein [Planctomycetota bacterium]